MNNKQQFKQIVQKRKSLPGSSPHKPTVQFNSPLKNAKTTNPVPEPVQDELHHVFEDSFRSDESLR